MRILISNDDGIRAQGIKTLTERLVEASHEVFVCAPDRERSTTGHALTMHEPLRVESVDLHSKVRGAWSTSGTPADCVKFALSELMPEPPDIVVTGINHGPNLGTDVLYSGTVAAAMAASCLGIPSIAVSAYQSTKRSFQIGADFVAGFINVLPQCAFRYQGLMDMFNINIPKFDDDKETHPQLMITRLGVRRWHDYFEKRQDPRGKTYYWLVGEVLQEVDPEPETDTWAVANNFISLTPVAFNMTDEMTLAKMKTLTSLKEILVVKQ